MKAALRLSLSLLLTLAACSTVPGTGRHQLRFMSTEQEMQLGASAYDDALKEATVISTGADAEMVQRVGKRIATAAKRLYPDPARKFDWEIKLLDAPDTVNAWALPGGKAAVYSGLLPVTQDEASLAIVVGHEVGHAIAHHGAERMSQQMVFNGALTGASVYLSAKKTDPGKARQIMGLLGAGGTVGVLLPFSRKQESEADELGLYLAAAAGYDPHAAIGLWQRMERLGGSKPPEFLSTHPSEGRRIQRLQKVMPKAMEYYREAQRRGLVQP